MVRADLRRGRGVDWKAVTTAGAWQQLINYLWPEVHKWAGRLRWDKIRDKPFARAELLNLNLRLTHGAAFAAAWTNPALIEGAHADRLLIVYDEARRSPLAHSTPAKAHSAARGGVCARLVHPGSPQGRFYDIHAHGPVTRTGTPARHPRRCDRGGPHLPEWAEQRRRQWGEQSAIYVNRVLGEFHAGDEDSVIPLAWAEAAVERWHDWDEAGRADLPGPHIIGVDVARSGEDRTSRPSAAVPSSSSSAGRPKRTRCKPPTG